MADRPILTLTLNPALDESTHVARVVAGEKLRCAVPKLDPGGGGINVSRAIHQMGGQSLALVALGGAVGDELAALLAADGIRFEVMYSPGPTRRSLTVTEKATGQQFRFVMPGPHWGAQDQACACDALAKKAQSGGLGVISGSQPPGVPDDFPKHLAAAMAGMELVLDTSGRALARAVAHPIAGLAALRMDSAEAEALAGTPLTTARDTADFAQRLARLDAAQVVLIARAAEGNVLATAEHRLIARPPVVPEVSTVGAGDSFVAGWVLARSRGQDWPQALALGTAAAAAAVMTPATELCRAADVDRLLPQVTLSPI